ncbi:hypothetical protein KJ849_01150 [bacterium]|nr:hypothetical protein [bacterium]
MKAKLVEAEAKIFLAMAMVLQPEICKDERRINGKSAHSFIMVGIIGLFRKTG